jgi:hypothetical protein
MFTSLDFIHTRICYGKSTRFRSSLYSIFKSMSKYHFQFSINFSILLLSTVILPIPPSKLHKQAPLLHHLQERRRHDRPGALRARISHLLVYQSPRVCLISPTAMAARAGAPVEEEDASELKLGEGMYPIYSSLSFRWLGLRDGTYFCTSGLCFFRWISRRC